MDKQIELLKQVRLALQGGRPTGAVTLITLRSDDLDALNSFEDPKRIYPSESNLRPSGRSVDVEVKGRSLLVLRIPVD